MSPSSEKALLPTGVNVLIVEKIKFFILLHNTLNIQNTFHRLINTVGGSIVLSLESFASINLPSLLYC